MTFEQYVLENKCHICNQQFKNKTAKTCRKNKDHFVDVFSCFFRIVLNKYTLRYYVLDKNLEICLNNSFVFDYKYVNSNLDIFLKIRKETDVEKILLLM